MRILLFVVLSLAAMGAQAATNQCWSPPVNGYRVCADGVTVQSRATAGNYGDWSGGANKLWQNVKATEAVYVCELDLPAGAGDGCPTPADAKARYVLKSSIAAAPEPPPPPVVSGQQLVSWDAVTAYTDGSPITAAVVYRVYHGTSQAALTDVRQATASPYQFSGLAAGVHYFAVTAVVGGVESARSGVGSTVITSGCPSQPAAETRTQACPAGTTGTWLQSRTYSSSPTACWAAGEWLPASAPAGACTIPDPCVADPLVVTNLAWPSAQSGRRSLGYNTGEKLVAKVEFTWPGTLKFTDTRGCQATFTR